MGTEGNRLSERVSGGRPTGEVRPTACVGHPVAQVRGVLAERIVIGTSLDPYLSLKALSTYSSLSVRKLREHLTDPGHPLPCYRIGGKILVRRSEYDVWAAAYRRVGDVDVDRIVDKALRDLERA